MKVKIVYSHFSEKGWDKSKIFYYNIMYKYNKWYSYWKYLKNKYTYEDFQCVTPYLCFDENNWSGKFEVAEKLAKTLKTLEDIKLFYRKQNDEIQQEIKKWEDKNLPKIFEKEIY